MFQLLKEQQVGKAVVYECTSDERGLCSARLVDWSRPELGLDATQPQMRLSLAQAATELVLMFISKKTIRKAELRTSDARLSDVHNA